MNWTNSISKRAGRIRWESKETFMDNEVFAVSKSFALQGLLP